MVYQPPEFTSELWLLSLAYYTFTPSPSLYCSDDSLCSGDPNLVAVVFLNSVDGKIIGRDVRGFIIILERNSQWSRSLFAIHTGTTQPLMMVSVRGVWAIPEVLYFFTRFVLSL